MTTDEENEIRRLQLEIGGSYFELIEFTLTRQTGGVSQRGRYGVNVAKVREVVRMPKINTLASRVPGIAGIFELRGVAIPAVNLAVALGDEAAVPGGNHQIIVTEFSKKRAGFIVDQTHRIRRVAWDKVMPPASDTASCINGMTLIENNEFLFILDLERILLNLEFGTDAADRMIDPVTAGSAFAPPGVQVEPAGAYVPGQAAPGSTILLVDDSSFIRAGVRQALQRAGYQVVEATDGQDALRQLEASVSDNGAPIDLVVTDVEMPRMDGLSLVKRIRDHQVLAAIPIIFHTSLSGRANQAAGMAVGANGYVIKNDLKTLFEQIRTTLGNDAVGHAVGA